MVNSFLQKLKGTVKSLTVWFNSIGAAVLIGLPLAQESLPQLAQYIGPDLYKKLMAAVIVGNILLRFRTSKPLEQK